MEKPQTFRSPLAVVVWIVWLLFAVGNWIDLAVQGRDHGSVLAAAILLLATGVAYVTALRPRVIADADGVTVRNPLRDHRVGWTGVAKVDLSELLRVHCVAGQGGTRRKVISAWAVHYSRRRKLAAEARARRRGRSGDFWRSTPGLPASTGGRRPYGVSPDPDASAAEAEAERIVRVLSDYAAAARAETAAGPAVGLAGVNGTRAATATAAAGAGTATPLTSTWDPLAVAAVVGPALILLIVSLL